MGLKTKYFGIVLEMYTTEIWALKASILNKVNRESYDVGFNPSTQRHNRRLIYYLYIYIYSYMFRSYDHQGEKYITTLGLLN
jgi:hypothetical protein